MTDSESDSLEEDEIIKKIMGHNFAGNSRPHSQTFKKTPEMPKKIIINSVKNSKKTSPIFSPKPRTTRNSIICIKTPEEINLLSKQTSQQIIKSVYKLVSSKLPINLCESTELTEKDQADIQNFFMKKKTQFKQLLEEISEKNNNNVRKFVKDSLKSTQAIENKYLQEIKNIQKKQKYMKKELVKKTSERILKERCDIKKNKEIEVKKKKIEAKKIQNFEKELIIRNIDNFYKDKINLVKDYFQKETETKKSQHYEEKKVISDLIKEQKQKRLKRCGILKQKYEQELEKLKEKFNSIH